MDRTLLTLLALAVIAGSIFAVPSAVGISVVYPTGDLAVNQYRAFNVTVNVTCIFGTCGDVNATLDPMNIYVFQGGDSECTESIKPILESAGFSVTCGMDQSVYDGTMDLAPYSSAMVLAGTSYSSNMPTAGQDAINAYVRNGGGLIVFEWSAYDYYRFIVADRVSGYTQAATYATVGTHPITDGLPSSWTSPRCGFSSLSPHTNSVSLIDYSGYGSMLVVNESGNGKIAEFAISPGYNGEHCFNVSTSWDNNMTTLLKNAVIWVSHGKGDIPVGSGTPFYTDNPNPRTINLGAGQSQLVTYWVNATGPASNYTFFAYANETGNMGINDQTDNWTISVYPQPRVSFQNLPSTVTTPDPATNVTVNISAEYFLGTPESVTLDRIWWNNGTRNLSYTAPVNHSFSQGSHTLTAYANDTEGNVYSSTRTLSITMLACGSTLDSDLVMDADLDCSAYSGNALEIEGEGITLDCAGHSITGGGSFTGVYTSSDRITVKNCVISGFGVGVHFDAASGGTIQNNTFSDMGNEAVYIDESENNTIIGNRDSGSYDGIYLDYADGNTIRDNRFEDEYYGSYLYYSDSNIISGNQFTEDQYGFFIDYSDNNDIGSNIVTDTEYNNFGGSSCPFLYTWNGTGYDFVSDVSRGGRIGSASRASSGRTVFPAEYSRIAGDSLIQRDGTYQMKLTEEYDELSYLDEVGLLTVDHASDVDVYPGLMKENFDTFYTVSKNPETPVSCEDDAGNGCLAGFESRDGIYTDHVQNMTLDLGDLEGASSVKLILSIGSATVSGSGTKQIQVKDEEGNWVSVYSGNQFTTTGGMPRTVVVDLTGKFPTSDHGVRLVFPTLVFDYIALDTTPQQPLTVSSYPPSSADLHYRGYSEPIGDKSLDYGHVSMSSGFHDASGNFTKYGDVLPLLTATDDKYVIMNHGDEISALFPYSPPSAGTQRDFMLYSWDYYKQSDDTNGTTVAPLPFKAMSTYPYPENESYPSDADHQAYIAEYNTRQSDGGASAGGSLPYSFNNTVHDNIINGGPSSIGLYLYEETETILRNNRISNARIGIESDYSDGLRIERNTISNASEQGIYLYNEYNDTVLRNTIQSGTGIYLYRTDGSTFLGNTIRADTWIYNEEGGELALAEGENFFNDSTSGNRYYFPDGSGAWTEYNISDTNGDGWADVGSDLPFSCVTIGECVSDGVEFDYWFGPGEDWHPGVAPVESGSSHNDAQKKSLSLAMDATCNGTTITVTSDGNPIAGADVNADGVRVGTTDENGQVEYSPVVNCGESVSLRASKEGYSYADGDFNLVACGQCTQPECQADSDCPDTKACSEQKCVAVECSCGSVSQHQCTKYECCSNSDCKQGETCQGHSCKETEACVAPGCCTADSMCADNQNCVSPAGAQVSASSPGKCKDITGQCGTVKNHAFVAYGYECGTEPGCPSCQQGATCTDHKCVSGDLKGPQTGFVGDNAKVQATEGDGVCKDCDIQGVDPTGKNFTGKTGPDGSFSLPLTLQGTYKVSLLKDGAIVKTIQINSLPKAPAEEPVKPTATGGTEIFSLIGLLVLLLVVILGVVYWRSTAKGKK